jgi:hypothetical protein
MLRPGILSVGVLSRGRGTGISTEPQYRIFTDENGLQWRKGIRDGFIVLDIALTATGFNGTEDLDWENINNTKLLTIFDFWTPALIDSKMLFWGRYSDISAGQMNNMVIGALDYLTVIGNFGLETYQAPHNATYEAADTDYIWFKIDSSQRIVTTAELIGYDFTRTFVKYDSNSPNYIQEIIILKSGETLTESELNYLKYYMQTSIWWDGTLSTYGAIKSNRPIAQKYIFTVEDVILIQDTFTDTNGVRLNAHTMNIGSGWTENNGTWTILSNHIKQSVTTWATYRISTPLLSGSLGTHTLDVSVDVKIILGALNYIFYLEFLSSDLLTRSYVDIDRNHPALGRILWYGDPNDSTGTRDEESGVTRTLRVVICGRNVKVYWGGTLTYNVTENTDLPLTRLGLARRSDATYKDSNIEIDNLIATLKV